MPEHHILNEIVNGIRLRGRGVLLFDYDGTLAPISDHPQQAQMPSRVRRAVERLRGRPSIAIGILSGRSISDLRQMVRINGLYLAGLCGLEMEFCGNTGTVPDRHRGRVLIETVMLELRQPIRVWPPTWMEDKGLGLTVHYRGLSAEDTVDLLTHLREVLDRFYGEIQVKRGPMAIEVFPAFGRTKGTAVREILKRLPYRKPFVMFAGDSENDMEAFMEVQGLDGLTIGIGEDSPDCVEHRLESPSQLASVLQMLAGQIHDIAPQSFSTMACDAFGSLWRPLFPIGPV